MRSLRLNKLKISVLAGAVAGMALLAPAAEPAAPLPTGSNVLVIANRAWRGRDGREAGESEKVARYYMARRAVPDRNLLLVEVEPEDPGYAAFHARVIVPLAEKLEALRRETGREDILYILCCYGVPIRVRMPFPADTYGYPQGPAPVFNPDGSVRQEKQRRYAGLRAADGFLCYPRVLAKLASNEAPGWARERFGGVFDTRDFAPPILHPYYGLCVKPGAAPDPAPLKIGFGVSQQKEAAMSFGEARRRDPNRYAYCLVCRLDAPNPLIAKSLVDKAVYAETYLRHPAAGAPAPYRTQAVFDLGELAASNEQIRDAADWFAGLTPASPFAGRPWPTIVDTGIQPGQEIGLPGTNGAPYLPNDPSFSPTNWPLGNVAWYAGTYTTWGRYQDAYRWAVGSVGLHIDSGNCADIHTTNFDAFARSADPGEEGRPGFVPHALVRNLTASAGVVHEPFESGITDAGFLFRALSLGMPFADACYAATRDIFWKSTFIGDPLYRPFGGPKAEDKEPPKILSAEARAEGGRWRVTAQTDKPCRFAVTVNGKEIKPFERWGKSWEDRDWFFGCELDLFLDPSAAPAGTAPAVTVRARSPAGLESALVSARLAAVPAGAARP